MTSTTSSPVWFDIPVADLQRACEFYQAVLNCKVSRQANAEAAFLEHASQCGCLVLAPSEVSATKGALVYLNVQGRLGQALNKVIEQGGKLVQDIHTMAPLGKRAIVIDSEGNRLALYSS